MSIHFVDIRTFLTTELSVLLNRTPSRFSKLRILFMSYKQIGENPPEDHLQKEYISLGVSHTHVIIMQGSYHEMLQDLPDFDIAFIYIGVTEMIRDLLVLSRIATKRKGNLVIPVSCDCQLPEKIRQFSSISDRTPNLEIAVHAKSCGCPREIQEIIDRCLVFQRKKEARC